MRVYDYKGGELSTEVNLDYDSLISSITEMIQWRLELDPIEVRRAKGLDEITDEKDSYLEYVIGEVTKYLKNDFYSTYAAGDGFTGKIFEVENSRMKAIKIEEHIIEISKMIISHPDNI